MTEAPPVQFRLDGRCAVITGAGGAIGAASAVAFAQAGADIVLIGRTIETLDKTANAVKQTGRRVMAVAADVTDEAGMQRAADIVAEAFGRADILFNNAGTSSPKAFLDYSLAEWKAVIDVNLTGAFLATRVFAPGMIAGGYGRVINMGSILSGRGMALRSSYCASKAGLANFGAALAFELGPHGVTVNTVGATVIATDFNRSFIAAQPQLYDGVKRRSAVGRLGELVDIMGLLVFLASPAAAFITGQMLYADGGYTAG
jgi:NAD(P)-dependent dehydrogenase (short-subunit alcohol dehydrogenase family)